MTSLFFNERNQFIHIQWWCLDNCSSYISHNIFFFTSLVAHFDFPYFCWFDNNSPPHPQGKISVFQSIIFWEDRGSNKRPNIPWFSSNIQKITIVYNLIHHVLNIYSVNRFVHRETLMKAMLIHLEGLPEDLWPCQSRPFYFHINLHKQKSTKYLRCTTWVIIFQPLIID